MLLMLMVHKIPKEAQQIPIVWNIKTTNSEASLALKFWINGMILYLYILGAAITPGSSG